MLGTWNVRVRRRPRMPQKIAAKPAIAAGEMG